MQNKLINNFINNKAIRITKLATRQTNTKMNLVKTYAIVAVVCSHTNGGGIVFPMSNWFSPFYYFMPLFVFVSGYFYNEKYDSIPFFSFIKGKISTLVIPYFVWNFIYGLINLLFRSLNVINYGDSFNLKSLLIRPWIDGHQFHFNIAAWFMLSLFLDILLIFILRKILKKIHLQYDTVLLLVTFAISVFCIIFAQKGYNTGMYLCITKAGFMLPYYQLGFWYKKHENIFNKHKAISIGILFSILYLCLVFGGNQGLNAQVVFANFKGNPFTISLTTTATILLTSTVCEILEPAFSKSKIINTIGDNTFSVMMHHGIIIFTINFALYILSRVADIASFDVGKFQSTLWYVYPWRDERIFLIYVISGVMCPILMKLLYNKVILNLCKKLNQDNTKVK